MKMLPEVLFDKQGDKGPSKAERHVFQLLRDSGAFPGATALHSLNCSEHKYKQWSEIDFCIVAPEGVFVLEVKGGGVSIVDGVWHFQGANRRGEKKEGPFEQASSARFSLEKLLDEKYRIQRDLSTAPVYGFGVVFVDTPWDTHSPEMPREIVADRGECKDVVSFDRYLARLASYWRNKKKFKGSGLLEKSDIQKIRETMRPSVDFFPPFSMRMGEAMDRIQKMTEDQYRFLEFMEPNDQIVITGGAGTGKTFLAVQCARMEERRGRRTAIVVESPTLAAYIRKMEPSKDIAVLTLPQAKHLQGKERFDVLLIDEGQDLLSIDSLSVASDLLQGGLEGGRWRWFMDINKQAYLRGTFEQEALDALLEGYGSSRPSQAQLSTNVRNTKEIIAKVESWTDAELGTTTYTGHGGAPKLVVVEDMDAIASALEDSFAEYLAKGVPLEDIGIVMAERLGDDGIGALQKRLPHGTIRLGPSTAVANLRGKAVIGNAADFKGLERPIILAVGFDYEEDDTTALNELYVATTRGNYGLAVLGSKKLIDKLKSN